MTILNIQFYDHENNLSSPNIGLNPEIKMQIDHKVNLTPEFFKYLETGYLIIEVYFQSNDSSIKIGVANLSMNELLMKSIKTKNESLGNNPIILFKSEIVSVNPDKVRIVTITSFASFLNDITIKYHAFKAEEELNKTLENSVMSISKIISISIVRISDCVIKDKTIFINYIFYNLDDHISESIKAHDCEINDTKNFSIKWDKKFLRYLETGIVEFKIFDDSDPSSKSIDILGLGSMRLNELLTSSGIIEESVQIKSTASQEEICKLIIKIKIEIPNDRVLTSNKG